MPPPDRPDDPDHNTFELRKGQGNTTQWRGIRLQGSAAMLKPGELRQGQNIRPDGDGYRDRGGQEKIVLSAVPRPIDGIYDFGDIGSN